jgi:hypothetical protein
MPAGSSSSTDETALDLQFVRYQYPGANPGYGINYNELMIAALQFSRLLHGDVAYSDDFLRSGESALYYHVGAEFPLGVGELSLKLGAGFNDISM